MALRREKETLENDYANLAELFEILRKLPEEKSFDLLKTLRLTTTDPAHLLPFIKGDKSGIEALPHQVLVRPPGQGGLEFELMVRHAMAYPTLVPLDVATVGSTTLHTAGLKADSDPELTGYVTQFVPKRNIRLWPCGNA
jgi:hypothetical protein